MMEQNGSKKILLSVLGVAILIVAVVGISFAALNYDAVGGTNSITTGTITMSFAESTNGIYLSNALPMDDTTGKGLKEDREYFDFSVTTSASAAIDVNYEINITPTTTTSDTVKALEDGEVKIYLEEYDEDTATYKELVAPVLISDLSNSTVRTSALVLTPIEDSYTATTGGSTTRDFRLRIWVNQGVDTNKLSADENIHYEYKLRVNVDGRAAVIGQ